MKKLKEEIKSLFLTVIFFVFITSALIQGSIVPTPSMEKTILVGDRLFVNKFIFGASTPTYIPFTIPLELLGSVRFDRIAKIVKQT